MDLLEREQILRELPDHLDQAAHGHGQLVLLAGEAASARQPWSASLLNGLLRRSGC
jgi:hypothetical protein